VPEAFVALADLLRARPLAARLVDDEPDAEPVGPVGADASQERRTRARLAYPCGFGRAFDGDGASLDDGPPVRIAFGPLDPPGLSERVAPEDVAWTGVRAIDGLLALARGARIGIFGAPGTGKSSLLDAIARGTDADALVVGLVGERGREAETWLRRLDARTTLVCATSDRAAGERIRACESAFAHASALRARGLHVLLVIDSIARYANALRETALASGEASGRGGFPPSVFARLARAVECAGATPHGSVTLIATVLDDGDDRDPVSDAARSLLDGHVALCPRIARAGRFPAIDVLASASRTMDLVAGPAHRAAAARVRAALARLAAGAEARALGLAPADAAERPVEAFLRQGPLPERPAATLAFLAEVADNLPE